jgi:phage tail sheath gpL-like
VTPSIHKAQIIAQYRQMEFDGLLEDADAMAKATIVERNARDPSRLDVLWAPYLVSGFRIVPAYRQGSAIPETLYFYVFLSEGARVPG